MILSSARIIFLNTNIPLDCQSGTGSQILPACDLLRLRQWKIIQSFIRQKYFIDKENLLIQNYPLPPPSPQTQDNNPGTVPLWVDLRCLILLRSPALNGLKALIEWMRFTGLLWPTITCLARMMIKIYGGLNREIFCDQIFIRFRSKYFPRWPPSTLTYLRMNELLSL